MMQKIIFACCTCVMLNASFATAQVDTFRFLFDQGKSRIAPFEARIFAKQYKDKKFDSVAINSYTDSVGSIASNIILGKKREQAVLGLLFELGFRKKTIGTKTNYGESKQEYLTANLDSLLQNRRVVVTLFPYVEKPKPATIPEKIVEPVKEEIVNTPKVAEPVKLAEAKFEKGEKIVIDNLTFEGQRHVLTQDGEAALQKLIEIVISKPKINFTIVGHVCCLPPNAADALDLDVGTVDLSFQRAKAIYNRLLEAGVEAKRMKYVGKGGYEKLFPLELTMAEANANRRVEIIVTSTSK